MSGGPLKYLISDSRDSPRTFLLAAYLSEPSLPRNSKPALYDDTRLWSASSDCSNWFNPLHPPKTSSSLTGQSEVDPRQTTSNHPKTYRRLGEVIRFASILKWYIPLSPSEPDFRTTIPTPEPPCLPVALIHSLYFRRRSNQYPRLTPSNPCCGCDGVLHLPPYIPPVGTNHDWFRAPQVADEASIGPTQPESSGSRLAFLFRGFKPSIKEEFVV